MNERTKHIHEQLKRYRGAVDTMFLLLGLADRCSLQDFLDALQDFRQRPIHLQIYPAMPMPYTGMALVGSEFDLICYRDELSSYHSLQIICHEIIHLVRGHTDAISAFNRAQEKQHAHNDLQFFCGRSAYANAYEFEAEYSATYLANKLDIADKIPLGSVMQDYALLKPLHDVLRAVAPTVYLDLDVRYDSKGERDDWCASRLLSEITDARLLCYTSRQLLSSRPNARAGIDLGNPEDETLVMAATWEARLLRSLVSGEAIESIPRALSTAPYQSLEYYRLLATAVTDWQSTILSG